jgi:hypothetical protein
MRESFSFQLLTKLVHKVFKRENVREPKRASAAASRALLAFVGPGKFENLEKLRDKNKKEGNEWKKELGK